MRKVLYYHAYLNDNPVVWSDIVMEQMLCMENSGMLNELDAVYVTAITQQDNRMDLFMRLLSTFDNQFRIEFVQNPFVDDYDMVANLNNTRCITEKHTLNKIYQDALTNDDYVCYVHTKGSTSVIRHLLPGDLQTVKIYTNWRQYLNWGVLENWRECIDALEAYDTAGVNIKKLPSLHYSGNYWWTTSKHIRTLHDPTGNDWSVWWQDLKDRSFDAGLKACGERFKDEQWVCSRPGTKAFSLHDGFDPHLSPISRHNYEVKK